MSRLSKDIFPSMPHISAGYSIWDMMKTTPKLNICFLSLNGYKLFDPTSTAQMGGTELQMHTIATELSRNQKYDVSCIVGDFGQENVQQFGNIKVYSSFKLKKHPGTFLKAPFILFWIFARIRPDVIIASPAGPEIGVAGIYCLFSGTRLIFRTASDIDCNKIKERSMNPIARFLYSAGIRLASIVIVQHKNQQKDLKKFYQKESLIIKNGYSFPDPSLWRTEDRIVWIGSSRNVKRPDLFFALAKELPQYQFHMILSHSGDEDLYRWCKQESQKIPNITFHGELLPDEVNLFLQKSRVLIGTSDYEGSPNTYSMANIYRVPVVSLRVHCQGFCAGSSMEHMKREICNIMDNYLYYKKISDEAFDYAVANNTITSVVRDWTFAIQQAYYSQSN